MSMLIPLIVVTVLSVVALVLYIRTLRAVHQDERHESRLRAELMQRKRLARSTLADA